MELKNDHLLKKAPASVVVDSHDLIFSPNKIQLNKTYGISLPGAEDSTVN